MTWVTLFVAFALRVWLAAGGGQGYWPDENRYHAAAEAIAQFRLGETQAGWRALIGEADHPGFKVVALPAAWMDAHFGASPFRAAVYFGLFSVATLAAIGACARAAGAGPRESGLAVLFAASSDSLFYYTRHLLPYDVSLFFCTAALALGLQTGGRYGRSLAAGVLAACGFLCYDGYWFVGGAALAVHVLRSDDLNQAARRAGWAAAGLLLPLLVVLGGARLLGCDLVAAFRSFAGTIVQGDFGQGHRFIWQYLWASEGLLLVVWLAAGAYAIFRASETRSRGRPMQWLALLACLYAVLWVGSDVAKAFVVYGRLARVLAPGFCLVTAWAADDLWSRRRWRPGFPALGLTAIAAIAFVGFYRPLRQTFPGQFLVLAEPRAERAPAAVLRLLDVNRLPFAQISPDNQPRQVLLARAHPLQFRPYLYEGYTEAERGVLTRHDISMRLIRIDGAIAAWSKPAGYPGPIRLHIKFPAGRDGYSEPILSAGTAGRANFIFVRYLDGKTIRLGYDCWSVGGPVSQPLRVDLAVWHDLILAGPAMAPDEELSGPAGASRGSLGASRDLLVVLDGQVVLGAPISIHRSRADQVFIGVNFVGGSTAGESFSGEMTDLRSVGPAELAPYRSLARR